MKKAFAVLMIVLAGPGVLRSWGAHRTVVQIDTNFGDITVELLDDDAPITVANFLDYVESGFYEGLIFHRVINTFMIQGGAYDPNLYELDFSEADPNLQDPRFYHVPNDPIILEASTARKNLRGTIAMARTGDPDSATSQFFINQADNPHLDVGYGGGQGYAVFGTVSEGMEVVDDIVEVAINEDPCVTALFEALPVEPVTIEQVSVVREFDETSSDFSDEPFLHAQGGAIRTFVGQAGFVDVNYRHEFSAVEHLGIDCLEWKQVADEEAAIDDFTMLLARDTAGTGWILRYVLNEGTDNEVTLIEAATLQEAVSFSAYAEENMYFRLMTGQYNPTELSDPANRLTMGEGANTITEEIVDLDESVAGLPSYPDHLILVKWSRGPAGEETAIRWRYYHEAIGLVLNLWDAAGNPAGNGWVLAAMNFDTDSLDFSEAPFMKVPLDLAGYVRTYVGQDAFAGQNYTHTFTQIDEGFQGVAYLEWEQAYVGTGQEVDNFTLWLARDINETIWVFKYVLNGQTIIEAETLLEAVRFDSTEAELHLADRMLFRLINGTYNAEDGEDPLNEFVTGTGASQQTTRIETFSDTLTFVPHYQNELIRVVSYPGADPCAAQTDRLYYHASTGLVLDLRDGATEPEGDGWRLAFYGGRFDATTSVDFSDVAYLQAVDGVIRTYVGQGSFEGQRYRHTFEDYAFRGVPCLRWKQLSEDDSAPDDFDICLARDSLETIWVLRYYVNGERVYRTEESYDGRLLRDFADDALLFRLISGAYDPCDLGAATNASIREIEERVLTERIESFNRELGHLTFYGDDLLLSKGTEEPNHPPVDWSYYDEAAGLVLHLQNTTATSGDPNYFDPNTSEPSDRTLDGWRLGWYGAAEPTFASDSFDFSEVLYLKAQPGDFRLYQGQGAWAGQEYRLLFSISELLGVRCLKIEETAAAEAEKASLIFQAARDTAGGLWLLKAEEGGETLYEAEVIDQAVPFETYPDMPLRLMSGSFEAGTTIRPVWDREGEAAEVARLNDTVEGLDEYADELVLVRRTRDACDIHWRYFHESIGLVLEIRQDTMEPNEIDPAGDGWRPAEPSEIDDLSLVVVASGQRTAPRDLFVLSGTLEAEKEDFETGQLFLHLGPYQTELNTSNPLLGWRGQQEMFSTSPDGVSRFWVWVDLNAEWFWMYGSGLDLSGMDEPVVYEMLVGDYYGSGTATIAGGRTVPIILVRGYKDVLRKRYYTFVYDEVIRNDGISILGEIATKDYPLDLSELTLNIAWGETPFTLEPDQAVPLRRIGGERFFYYDASEALSLVYFDLERGYYQIEIRQSLLAKPPQDFSITMTDANNTVVFDESVPVP